jgi:hypothetical protein
MLLETILYISGIFLCMESIKTCFQAREHHELIPIYIQTVRSNDIDIETIAPLTEEILEDACSICLEPLQTIRYKRKTICGHTFCSECLHEWIRKKTTCPMCNRSFQTRANPFS